jgi:hypothetical protein
MVSSLHLVAASAAHYLAVTNLGKSLGMEEQSAAVGAGKKLKHDGTLTTI